MAGRTKWKDIKAQHLTPQSRQEAAEITRALLAEMPLAELRRARDMTQETLAAAMDTTQPEISKLERRTDTYISTLRRYVQAMGGELDVIVRFPDGSVVRINQFGELAESTGMEIERRGPAFRPAPTSQEEIAARPSPRKRRRA